MLDGLRGVAAIVVMFYHYTQHNGLHYFGGAWVAVDLFFILSGFVIAHSYSKKISEGMSFKEFMTFRLIRLGPLYILGLAIGLASITISFINSTEFLVSTRQILTAGFFGIFWLPYFNNYSWPFGTENITGPIFPLNDPAWSLFFELAVNIIYFIYLNKFHKAPQLKLVIFLFVVFICVTIGFRQVNPGWGGENFIFGFPRVVAEFFLGSLIYTLGSHNKHYSKPFIIFIGIATFFCFFIGSGKIAFICSLTLIPMTVIVMSTVTVTGYFRKVCKILGDISYPLYILHFPMYRLVYELFGMNALTPQVQTILIGSFCILMSLILMKFDLILRNKIVEIFTKKENKQLNYSATKGI